MSKQDHANPERVAPSTEQLTERENPENQRADTSSLESNEDASGTESAETGE